MYISPRNTRFTLPGKCAHVNGTLRKPRNIASIKTSDTATPYVVYSSARTHPNCTTSPGARIANSGSTAHTIIHLRVAERYGASREVSVIWNPQFAGSSDGKLKAARNPEIITNASMCGNSSHPLRSDVTVITAIAAP